VKKMSRLALAGRGPHTLGIKFLPCLTPTPSSVITVAVQCATTN